MFYHDRPLENRLLLRQETFVSEEGVKKKKSAKVSDKSTNTSTEKEEDLKPVLKPETDEKGVQWETDEPSDDKDEKDPRTPDDKIKSLADVGVQTEPTNIVEEVLTETITGVVPRSPVVIMEFSATQTSPVETSDTVSQTLDTEQHMVTSEQTMVTSDQHMLTSDQAADEMVYRVLLEHVSNENSEREVKSAMSESSTTILEDTSSLLSEETGRTTSLGHNNDKTKDLARTVNYLDLSRLGNEGETPNSDEIWVTVEDDNKFLTSDTETYSVATDKVSTVAAIKGHAMGSGLAENFSILNSASEAELAELGNESMISDNEAFHTIGALLKYQMDPIKSSLDSTGKTISEIADTLISIQVCKVLHCIQNQIS